MTELKFLIAGTVAAENFPDWISAHAKKLSVMIKKLEMTNKGLSVVGRGSPEMLEALMVACSLGPSSVLIDTVTVDE